MRDKVDSEETRIIYVYRYLSWALTSSVYLTGRPYSIIFFKLGVILSLLISSKIVTDLYIKLKENKVKLRTLLLIETVGITLLLLPTGGLMSPFIWYALNPTLVSASYLPTYFCWVNLSFYLFTGSIMSFILFNPNNISILQMFADNSNLILVFVLITLAVQLLANLAKKLYIQTNVLQQQKERMIEINEELKIVNIEKEESMEQIMSLYQVVEALNNHSSKEKLLETLSIYTTKLTKSQLCFFYIINSKEGEGLIIANKNLTLIEQEKLSTELQKLELQLSDTRSLKEISLINKEFLIMPILSQTTYFGILAIAKQKDLSSNEANQSLKNLRFLAELSAVTLERFNLEDIEDHLLLMEEQNRIANEIHDSVSQRLFSISYAIHGLLGRWNNISKEEIKDYLTEIRESSNSAMQELRNSIYKLSSKKKGEKSLEVTLRTFLESMSKLYSLDINLEIEGDEDILPLTLKKGFTRIIREACGNAVRHGRCKEINLDLVIGNEFTSLSITDNGKGFVVNKEALEIQKGLGISNMRNLVYSFSGGIEILSELGKGTKIHIIIPGEGFSKAHQEGFAI